MTADADTANALRARGERLTPQRLLVLEIIQNDAGHHTAERIYERVRAIYPYVNVVTIYRSLAWLKAQGLIVETDLGGGQAEYEYIGERPHHHLVCLKCGDQAEFEDRLVEPLLESLRARYGFEPRLEHLAVFGTCHACRRDATAASLAAPSLSGSTAP